MNFTFNDNVHILCLSCNVIKVGKLVRFRQKGQKQASFLAFHKCCQGCLLRGPRYISTSFILVCTLRRYIATGYQESLFVGWKVYSYITKVYSSSTNKAKIYSYSIFVQQMYWLRDKLSVFQFVTSYYPFCIFKLFSYLQFCCVTTIFFHRITGRLYFIEIMLP
jgi:hypothetical protein